MITLETRGFEEAADYLAQLEVDTPKRLGMVVEGILVGMSRFASSITPVVTGAMSRAWTWDRTGLEGRVFISPSATNPRSGMLVISYAEEVDARHGITVAVRAMGGRLATQEMEEMEWLR